MAEGVGSIIAIFGWIGLGLGLWFLAVVILRRHALRKLADEVRGEVSYGDHPHLPGEMATARKLGGGGSCSGQRPIQKPRRTHGGEQK